MNINVAAQNQGVIAWAAGTTNINPFIDLRHHVNFGFTFQVTADITADAVFAFAAAPPSAADPCVAGTQYPVTEVLTCTALWGATSTNPAQLTIPAGTKKGSICTAALPCKPDAFIQVEPVSGDTGKIAVVAVLGGPK